MMEPRSIEPLEGAWVSIAPLIGGLFIRGETVPERFDFGHGVSLRRPAPSVGDDVRLRDFLKRTDNPMWDASTSALVAMFPTYETAKDAMPRAAVRIRLAQLAIWLVKPTGLNFRYFAHFTGWKASDDVDELRYEHTEPMVRPVYASATAEMADSDFPAAFVIELDDLKHAAEIFVPMVTFYEGRSGSVGIALELTYESLVMPLFEIAYTMRWMALEALFGSSTEITFQISLRLAWLLGNDLESRRVIFKASRLAYSLRSRILHGSGLPLKETDIERKLQMGETNRLLRGALVKILRSAHLATAFQGSKTRKSLLDDLCLGAVPEEAQVASESAGETDVG